MTGFAVGHTKMATIDLRDFLDGTRQKTVAWCLTVGLGLMMLAQAGVAQTNLAPISFRNQVMPLLSKSGCNAGTCHGNANGKAGFKLSLRGQDPDLDWIALTRDQGGRRVNLMEPAKSLVLLKATTAIGHEGGQRFPSDSEAYGTLSRWIASGATDDVAEAPELARLEVMPRDQILIEPERQTRLQVAAVFRDGSRRDVSRVAVYEPSNLLVTISADGLVSSQRTGETTVMVRFLDQQIPVRLAFVPERPDFKWMDRPENNFIDHEVFSKLRLLRLRHQAE